MKIIFASSEAVPFCKTGGLADVAGTLPVELHREGHDVVLFLPLYRIIRQKFSELQLIEPSLKVPTGEGAERVRLWSYSRDGYPDTYFIDSGAFDRLGIYGDRPATEYHDNDYRYALFSRSVLEAAKILSFQPDIIHCHDWQTGLIPGYLRYLYHKDAFYQTTASLLTIHNMAYQGVFPLSSFSMTGLPQKSLHPSEMEFYGKMSYLKAGLVYSDGINTVSPTYAKEVRTDSLYGCGMEGVLQNRENDFIGILNGLDVELWNPATDSHLAQVYTSTTIKKRAMCKTDLQSFTGLKMDPKIPILGFIARLDYQKGVDILLEGAPLFLKKGVQLVLLGQGNPEYVQGIKSLLAKYPDQVAYNGDFSEPLAHKIYAGADIFLMPSRFEPCGLSQLIAMRYGCVPVVTPTGGLRDTVIPPIKPNSTGFVAPSMNGKDYTATVLEALELKKQEIVWKNIQINGMSKNFSWKKSVREYLALYRELVKKREAK